MVIKEIFARQPLGNLNNAVSRIRSNPHPQLRVKSSPAIDALCLHGAILGALQTDTQTLAKSQFFINTECACRLLSTIAFFFGFPTIANRRRFTTLTI